jgi:Fe-S cluster assembly ATP-binding protein
MLSISNLQGSIGDKPILKGLTLGVPAGEGLAIMGPNGVGLWYADAQGEPR